MTFLMDKGFLWRTSVVSLMIADLFLLSTGNPSITNIFGGLLMALPLMMIIVVITGSYGYGALRGKANKWHLVLHVLVIAALVFGLSKALPYAERRASARIKAEVDTFVKNPLASTAHASKEDRQLMLKIWRHNFTMERQHFIPTFRRADYLIMTRQGETYELILEESKSGTPEIWLGRADNVQVGTSEPNSEP